MVELTNDDLIVFLTFEKVTAVSTIDFVNNEEAYLFLVSKKELGKAIGKKGININKLKNIFNKKVYIVADAKDIDGFVKNLLSNAEIKTITIKEDVMGKKTAYVKVDDKDRGIVIGKNGEKVKLNNEMLKRRLDCSLRIV